MTGTTLQPAPPGGAGASTGAAGPELPGLPEGAGRPAAGGGSSLATLLLVSGVLVALAAQGLVGQRASGTTVLLAYAAAGILFLGGVLNGAERAGGLLTWRGPLAAGRGATARPRARPLRPPLFIGAIALGALTYLASGGNRFTALNVTSWTLSLVLGIAACWEGDPSRPALRARAAAGWARLRAAPPKGVSLRLSWTRAGLILVLLLGVALLFWRIDQVPAEMTSDHAEKLLDVRDVLDGQHRIFFPRNTGREAMQFYLIAAMTPLAGISYLTMKLGTAGVAALTLPFTFLLARVLFGSRLALLATAVLSTTRWLWEVARVGLRFPFPPAFGAAIFFLLMKAIRDRRRNDFLFLGLAVGLAQHSYTALRFAPLAVLACLGIALAVDVWRREPLGQLHRLVVDGLLVGVIALLAAMPLVRYAVDEPQIFLLRGATRIATDTLDGPPPNLPGVFLGNVRNAVLMFNWKGDAVWVNAIPGEPFLDPVSGALFVLGVIYAVYRLVRYRELPYLYLFVLMFVGLLPSLLSLAYPGENPSTVRMGMAIQVTVLFVAVPLMLLVRALVAAFGGVAGVVVGGVALAVLMVPAARLNIDQYFRIYARQHTQSSQHSREVARAVNGFLALGGRREDVYILPWANWFDTRLVAIQAGDIRWDPMLSNADLAPRADGVPRPRLYVVHPDDRQALALLLRWYPTATLHAHVLPDGDGQPFYVTVFVPPGAVAIRTTGGADAG